MPTNDKSIPEKSHPRQEEKLYLHNNVFSTRTISLRQAYILPTYRFEEKPVIIQFLEAWTTKLLRAKLNPGQQKDHMLEKVQRILTRIDVVAPCL